MASRAISATCWVACVVLAYASASSEGYCTSGGPTESCTTADVAGPAVLEYRGAKLALPFSCAGSLYEGPARGIAAGISGVAFEVRRRSDQEPVVAKVYSKGYRPWPEEECKILQKLESQRVPNVVRCEGTCEMLGKPVLLISPVLRDFYEVGPMRSLDKPLYGVGANTTSMQLEFGEDPRSTISQAFNLTEEFFEDLEHLNSGADANGLELIVIDVTGKKAIPTWDDIPKLDEDQFPLHVELLRRSTHSFDGEALERAVDKSLEFVFRLLAANVSQADIRNVGYHRDGTPTFFDMGRATDLNENSGCRRSIWKMLKWTFRRIPRSWWREGRAQKLIAGRSVKSATWDTLVCEFVEDFIRGSRELARHPNISFAC